MTDEMDSLIYQLPQKHPADEKISGGKMLHRLDRNTGLVYLFHKGAAESGF